MRSIRVRWSAVRLERATSWPIITAPLPHKEHRRSGWEDRRASGHGRGYFPVDASPAALHEHVMERSPSAFTLDIRFRTVVPPSIARARGFETQRRTDP